MVAVNYIKGSQIYAQSPKTKPNFGRREYIIKETITPYISDNARKTSKLKYYINLACGIGLASLVAVGTFAAHVKKTKENCQDSTRNYIALYNGAINNNICHKNEKAAAFINSLITQKTQLQETLGLNNKEYNNLAMLAIGIANHETSMGLNLDYAGKETFTGICEFIKGCTSKELSKGLSNIKIDQEQEPYTQKILDKFGINSGNIFEPEKAAMGTVIILRGHMRRYENAIKNGDIVFNKDNTLTKNEHALLCFNHGRHPAQIGNHTTKHQDEVIKHIIADRNKKNAPETYVGKVLKQL